MRKLAIVLGLGIAVMAGCSSVPLGPDTTPPTINLISPGSGTTATDSLVVQVTATDDRGVDHVDLYIVGRSDPVAVDSTSPYKLTAYLADVGSGPFQFTATAVDSAGNNASTPAMAFTSAVTPGLKVIGRLAVDGSARDVVVSGSYAYIAAWDAGVLVIDIHNPSVPVFVSRFDTDGFAQGLAVTATQLFVADGPEGVLSLSLADPTALTEQARIVPSGIQAWQVAIDGNYLYVAGGTAGLFAMNISNPDTIVSGSPVDLASDVRDVAVSGTRAFTAEGTQGVRSLSIANPDSIYTLAQFTSMRALDIHLLGNYAYVAAGTEGLFTLDISVTDSLKYGSSYNPGNTISGVAPTASYAYMAGGTAGVEVVNSASPLSLSIITNGTITTDGSAYRLVTSGNYVYVADNTYLTILRYVAP